MRRSLSAAHAQFARLHSRLRGSRDALGLALIGIVVGACAGAVSVAFRATIELCQFMLVPSQGFPAASFATRFALPMCGVLLVIAVVYGFARRPLSTGVVHVLDRITSAHARLPVTNALLQFLGGSLLLGSGMSMGREGPAIHLGAASASILGQRLRLPEGALRTLVGCGVAAAIGAAFNTPLAGVLLAIEVVLIEYTVRGFTPILLAAVTGATIGRLIYGAAPAFSVPQVTFGSSWELPLIGAMGLAIGGYAAAFIGLVREILRRTACWPWWSAMIAAGAVVAVLGMVLPQVLGIGYDVVELALNHRYGMGTLAAIAALKLIATAVGVGARLPAGLIGPTLVMGAAFGGVFGEIGSALVPRDGSNLALYVMLGMAGMMAATLQAPLSALVAVLELTGNHHVILPGILAIVTASIAARHIFDCEPIFAVQMREAGFKRKS